MKVLKISNPKGNSQCFTQNMPCGTGGFDHETSMGLLHTSGSLAVGAVWSWILQQHLKM